MYIHNMIVYTIVAGFVVLGHIHMSSADEFSNKQLPGTWYTSGIINPDTNASLVFSCSRTNITTRDSGAKHNVYARVIINGNLNEYEGIGEVVNSELHIMYPAIEETGTVFEITSFNNNQELILHDKNRAKCFLLLSRQEEPSAAVKAAFEKHATAVGLQVVYTHQEDCH